MLAVLLLGLVQSAVGIITSHGLAAVTLPGHQGAALDGHGHWHEDDDAGDTAADSAHPHHINDHSHEKPYTPPGGFASWAPQPPHWLLMTPVLQEYLLPYRWERPPRMVQAT